MKKPTKTKTKKPQVKIPDLKPRKNAKGGLKWEFTPQT